MKVSPKVFPLAVVVLVWWLVGCNPAVDSDVVARIDTKEIRAEELLQFKEEAEAAIKPDKEGVEALRYYLQTMIDMELMRLESLEQGLDQDDEFGHKWEEERRKKLVDEYIGRKIVQEIDLKPEELRQRFNESKWARMLKLAHIRSATEMDAQKALRDLEQGKTFEEVAQQYSTQPTTARRGGLLDPWYGRSNLVELGLNLDIGEALFEVELGDFAGPFQLGDNFEIFKVVEEKQAPTQYRIAYVRDKYWEEFQSRLSDLVDGLRAEMDVRIDQETVSFLVDGMELAPREGISLSPEDQKIVLCRFKGGALTLRHFADSYNALWFFRQVQFDSSGINQFIEQDMVPRALIYQAALDEGLDKDEELAIWLEHKKESMLVEELRQREVVARVAVDSAMARTYYEAHPERFMEFGKVEVVEILLKSKEEADKILEKIRAGGDLEALARTHSIRRDNEGGRFHMHNHRSERRVFGFLYDEVMQADLGVLKGPVQLEEGFSLFKVLSKTEAQPVPFEQAASRAVWWVKKQQERRLFDKLYSRIRDKYTPRVALYQDQLESLVVE